MATIKDVAALAQVSAATVSNYINGRSAVSAAKKSLIESAINTLGYVPNAHARALKCAEGNLVYVVLPNLSDSYYVQILQGAESELRKRKYDVSIGMSQENPDTEAEMITAFKSKRGAGLIIASCQPNRGELFTSLGVPVVQIDRRIQGLKQGYISFGYRDAVRGITLSFLRDRRKTAIIAGPVGYLSEDEAVAGFTEAHTLLGLESGEGLTVRSVTSKETAFFSLLELFEHDTPDVVISTSESYADGIREGMTLLGVEVPGQARLITLGVDTWCAQSRGYGIERVERQALRMGRQSAEMLDALIKNKSCEDVIIPLSWKKDAQVVTGYVRKRAGAAELRVFMPDFPQMHSFSRMIRQFENNCRCKVTTVYYPLDRYLDEILSRENRPDVFLIDRPWIHNMVEGGRLADISEYIGADIGIESRYLTNLLKSMCSVNGRYYGLPFLCMPQIMYYRNDLFTSPAIQRAYERGNHTSLRPPRTWAEYNIIASFFTRAHNPDSPTQYGSSFAAAFHSCFSPELYARLRECGGVVFDGDYNVALNSSQCRHAYSLMLENLENCPADYLEKDNSAALNDFLTGRSAMIVSFRSPLVATDQLKEYVGSSRIGYAMIPGRRSVLGGWFMSVPSTSEQKELGYKFIAWGCGERLAPYMTVLTGQSAIQGTYDSDELLMMHPWLPLLRYITESAEPIVPPGSFMRKTIPQSSISEILYDGFLQTAKDGCDLDMALRTADARMRELFSRYGYKQR